MIGVGILGEFASQPPAGTRIVLHRAMPQEAYRADLRQFDADEVLEAFGPDPSMPRPLVLLSSADLVLGGHPFVFGAARPDLGLAVVSTARLPTPAHLFSVLRHEWGHLHALGHCPARCVMRRARTPEDVLARGSAYCPACMGAVETAAPLGAGQQ